MLLREDGGWRSGRSLRAHRSGWRRSNSHIHGAHFWPPSITRICTSPRAMISSGSRVPSPTTRAAAGRSVRAHRSGCRRSSSHAYACHAGRLVTVRVVRVWDVPGGVELLGDCRLEAGATGYAGYPAEPFGFGFGFGFGLFYATEKLRILGRFRGDRGSEFRLTEPGVSGYLGGLASARSSRIV